MPLRAHPYFISLAGRIRADPRPELPSAVPPVTQPGAGVGPAFSDDVNTGKDSEEHPGSALERELEGR